MKKILFILALSVLTIGASRVYASKFFSLGIESLGNFTANSSVFNSAVQLQAYSVNVGVTTMGNKRLFLVGDIRLKVGSLKTNDFTAAQSDGTFFAGDIMGGLGFRILQPQGFGFELAPTLSAFLDLQFDSVLGFSYHYGPALGLNAFLKLGKGFGLGIRAIGKYSITARRIQPSIQVGLVF